MYLSRVEVAVFERRVMLDESEGVQISARAERLSGWSWRSQKQFSKETKDS